MWTQKSSLLFVAEGKVIELGQKDYSRGNWVSLPNKKCNVSRGQGSQTLNSDIVSWAEPQNVCQPQEAGQSTFSEGTGAVVAAVAKAIFLKNLHSQSKLK